MGAQVPHHLATNALDTRQLFDRAEGMLVAIGQDVADTRRPDARQQVQFLGRGNIDVDHTLQGGLLRLSRRAPPEHDQEGEHAAARHASVVGARNKKLLGEKTFVQDF